MEYDLIKKFQDIFDTIGYEEKINVNLNAYEILDILNSLKASDFYLNLCTDGFNKMFDKLKQR